MKRERDDSSRSPDIKALLDHERVLVALPDATRARALARARAASPSPVVSVLPWNRDVRRRPARMVAAAGFLGLAMAAVGTAAFWVGRSSAPSAPQTEVPLRASALAPPPLVLDRPTTVDALPAASEAVTVPLADLPSVAAPPSVVRAEAKGATPTKVPSRSPRDPQESVAELQLLQQAREAVGRRDFTGALALLAEHARRFPAGHLAEEREALRIRSLSAIGRGADARQAAGAFRKHFPASVLLPRASEMSRSPE